MVDPPPLVRPVEGPVASRFSFERAAPFRRGRRRVVRFQVETGTPVLAPCTGRITHAGPTPGGPAVTIRCGAWSVTLTGVAPAGARRGRTTRAGRSIGRARTRRAVGAGRAPTIGLGVRRASDPFGYVDPLPLLRDPDPARRFVPLGPAPRTRPVAPAPAPMTPAPAPMTPAPAPVPPARAPVAVPAPAAGPASSRLPVPAPTRVPAPAPLGIPTPAPTRVPVPETVRVPTDEPAAPLVAWIGLALAAVGLPAGAVGVHTRRRRVAVRPAERSAVGT